MYREAIPEGTFLHDYLHYTSPLETPLAYDFWTGLWLLSTVIGRRAYIARPHAPVYLNLYVILCADAGVTRKSSSLRMAEKVLYDGQFHGDCNLITGRTTTEAFTQLLADQSQRSGQSQGAFLVSELVTVLGREQYTASLPGLLTDLYDAPRDRVVRKLHSETLLTNVYVTFLAASTSAWLVRSINPDVIEGGFTSRCLFVIEERRKRVVAWPEPHATDPVPGLVAHLRDIRSGIARWNRDEHGEFGIPISDAARERFIRWYGGRKATGSNSFTTSFEAREDHHVLRLAGLLACNDLSFVVSKYHVDHAIRIIAEQKRSSSELFGEGKEVRKLVRGLDKLRSVLGAYGDNGIKHTDLYFKVRGYMTATEMQYALEIMHELEMVLRFDIPTRGRNTVLWRGTPKLTHRTAAQVLNDRMTTEVLRS